MNKLRKIIVLLWNNLASRFLGILGFLWLMLKILKEFGVINLNSLGVKGAIDLFVAAFVMTLLSYLNRIRIKEGIFSDPDDSKITKHLRERIGTVFSLITSDPSYIDRKHEYFLLRRQDFLDYEKGDYNSFRHIKGINKSSHLSDGIIYCESTEYKISFNETRIEAIDMTSGEPLRVEPLKNPDEKCITHAFKIHFKRPLRTNEQFNIAYMIFLPNELKCLDQKEEIMSISLVRIKKQLQVLEFNICLNFKPRSVKIYAKSMFTGRMKLLESFNEEVVPYNPSDELEKKFKINWTSTPYIIKTIFPNPKSDLYVIKYIN